MSTPTCTAIKLNRVRKLADTARYPRTFAARLQAIPDALLAALTARQIAALIDGPMAASYSAGHQRGCEDAR